MMMMNDPRFKWDHHEIYQLYLLFWYLEVPTELRQLIIGLSITLKSKALPERSQDADGVQYGLSCAMKWTAII